MTENRPGEGKIITDPDTRAHLYFTAMAIAAVLVGAGFLAAEQAQLYLNLAAALIGLGGNVLARFNVPNGRHVRE